MKSPKSVVEVNAAELIAIIEKTKQGALSVEDYEKLKVAGATVVFLQEEIKKKRASISRLRGILFGAGTEKTSRVLRGGKAKAGTNRLRDKDDKAKPAGHGRNGAAAYTGADRVRTAHPALHRGNPCPCCTKGSVYPMAEPEVLVRITGIAPLSATVYEDERLRCNLCGEVFTAPAPEEAGDKKYDETATAMIGELKYGAGLPFNRIAKLQAGMGIPLPATTQWELVRDGAAVLEPVHSELIHQAAQGKVLYNDDTTMKVLDLTREQRAAAAVDDEGDERTGVFTSGIVSTGKGHPIALFFTGVQHAGENLADVLAKRATDLPKPIQMCDALSANTTGDFESIVANCNSHARRRYVDVAQDFPEECRYVLETLREVYKNDAVTRKKEMSATERLAFHKQHSGPLMDGLEKWMRQQFDERKVEPNSGLGEAIGYMQKHWLKLTLFLRRAGAPLDNNICERALKRAILHRKNSLFYKTSNGAHVGDLFMSFIHTAELNEVKPFDYLVALLRHPKQIAKTPADWMPWSYHDTLAHLDAEAPHTGRYQSQPDAA
jgi:transposase